MDVLVLNQNFETIGIIDYYVSLIWTERYAEAGDFELYLRSDSSVFKLLKLGYYLWLKGSKMTMIVEKIEVNTDEEDGNEIIVSGRSLESILDRRIIWPQTNLDGALTGQIGRLIKDAIINPPDWKSVDGTQVIETGANRKIENVVYKRTCTQAQYDALPQEEKTDGTIYNIVPAGNNPLEIQNLQLKAQYTGDNLYETICAVCAAYGLGFRVMLTDDNKFEIELYQGLDRSYDQTDLTYVIFSTKFDNLISSNYLETNEAFKSVTIVAGEGEGTERKRVMVASENGAGMGLGRREMFTDARDISSTSGQEVITPEAYNYKLQQKGVEDLAKNVFVTTFEGQVQDGMTFTYGVQYFMGDVVQLVDEYDRDTTVRVTELIRSHSTSGLEVYPTFVSTYKAIIHITGNIGDTINVSGTGYGYGITMFAIIRVKYPEGETVTLSKNGIVIETSNTSGSYDFKITTSETYVVTYSSTAISIATKFGKVIQVDFLNGGAVTTLDEKPMSITIIATGDYDFTGKLTNIKKTIETDATALSYDADLRFIATFNLITNPYSNANPNVVTLLWSVEGESDVVAYYWLISLGKKTIDQVPEKKRAAVQKLLDDQVKYTGTPDANGAVSFVCYRYGVYDIFTSQTVIDDPDDHSGETKTEYTGLSVWPVSKESINLDFFDPNLADGGGKVYTGYCVSVYDLQGCTASQVDRQTRPTDVYIYWDPIKEGYGSFYNGVEIWESTINYPDVAVYDPEQIDYTNAEKKYTGTGNPVTISDEQKLAYTRTGLSYNIQYYWSVFPFVTINGVNYYGPKKQLSIKIQNEDNN